jgi:hypothetical protein
MWLSNSANIGPGEGGGESDECFAYQMNILCGKNLRVAEFPSEPVVQGFLLQYHPEQLGFLVLAALPVKI